MYFNLLKIDMILDSNKFLFIFKNWIITIHKLSSQALELIIENGFFSQKLTILWDFLRAY